MIGRLIGDLVRRQAWLYGCATLLWAAVTLAVQYLNAPPEVAREAFAQAQRGFQPLLPSEIGRSLSLILAIIVGPLAMGAFTARAFRLLPVSRRDLWLARWTLGTVGTATWVTVGNVLGVTAAVAIGTPAVDEPITLLLTWPVVVTYAAACYGVIALLVRTKTAAAFLRRGFTPRSMGTLLVVYLVGGMLLGLAVATGVLVRTLWPTSWSALAGLPGIACAIAAVLAIIGYRHHPESRPGASPVRLQQSANRSARVAASPFGLTRVIARLERPFAGIGLLLWSSGFRGLFGCVVIAAVLVPLSALSPRMSMAAVVSNFAAGMEFHYLGMIPIIDGIWGALLLVSSINPITASLRHLRTLPLSWGTLNALMLASPLAFLLGAIASLAILHLAILGTLPHIDAGRLVLALGMASFAHTWQLPFGRRFSGFLSWVPMLVIVVIVGLALRVLPAGLALPVVFGTLLILMAVVANAWLLTRSSSYLPSRNEQVLTPTF